MRPRRTLVALLLVGCSLVGCSAATRRPGSTSSLIARAWSGGEPLPTGRGAAVARFAAAQVGKRYCWGGVGPTCFDCSGLVQRAWRSAGVPVPRTADQIASSLSKVPLSDVRTGDILWWPGHVGIYAGNGWMVDALDTPHGVVRRPAVDPLRALRPSGAEAFSDSR